MHTYNRAAILDVLYTDVIRASKLADETKDGAPQAHTAALQVLQKAVERYTDFSLDGHLPQDFSLGRSQ